MCSLVAVPAAAFAQSKGDVFDQFFRYVEIKSRNNEPHLPGETVDHFTGTLRIVQEDLSLPGKAGLDLHVVRTYSSKIWGRSDLLTPEPFLADKEPTVVGLGWSLHMGRVRSPLAFGQPPFSQVPVYEAPQGTTHAFYPLTPTQAVSRASWKYTRDWQSCSGASSGQGACITTSSGLRLEFDAANSYFIGTTLVYPLSRIVDLFGNQIEVRYERTGSLGGSTGRIRDIEDSVVSFTYSQCGSGCNRLDSITAAGAGGSRQVTYSYTRSNGRSGQGFFGLGGGREFLTGVQPAAGPGYRYDYGYDLPVAQNQYALTSITYPYGGSSTYAYETASFFTGCDTVPMAVVRSRTVAGRGLRTARWTYTYVSPTAVNPSDPSKSDYQQTNVLGPDSSTDIFEFFGFAYLKRLNAIGNAWKVGLQYRVTRAAVSPGIGAEVETSEWSKGEPVVQGLAQQALYSAPSYGGTCPAWSFDSTVQSPVMTKRTIERMRRTGNTYAAGARYVTEYSDFDPFPYGQAGRIIETGEAHRTSGRPTRTTTLEHDYDTTTNQLVGRVTREEICEGNQCYENTRTFAGPHGTLDSETLKTTRTKFTYWPDGSLNTVENMRGHVLTLSGYAQGYGVATDVDYNGAFSIHRTVSWDGSLRSETNGRGDVTSYTYDAGGRLRTVTPPAGNDATTYCYDVDAAGFQSSYSITVGGPSGSCASSLQAGQYRKTMTLDGMGRVLATQTSLNERQSREFDELGRLAFESYPYEAGSAEIGDRYDYDHLGRRTITFRRYRPTAHLPLAGSCTDPASCQLTITYDDRAHCRTTRVNRAANDATSTVSCFISFGTPADERLITVTANNLTWTYGYTVAGAVATLKAPLPAGDRTLVYHPGSFWLDTSTTGPTGTTKTPKYNILGQPEERTDARSITTHFEYDDPLSRLTKTRYGAGSDEDTTRTYKKDLVDTVSSVDGGKYTYAYDEAERLVSLTWDYRGQQYVTRYHYDGSGCLDSMTYPTGTVATMTCDAAARTKSITLSGASPGAIVANASYHPSGRPTSITYGNGQVVTAQIVDGRLRRIQSKAQSATQFVVDLTYLYDGANNVKSITDAVIPANSVTGIVYDPLDRLHDVPVAGGKLSYRYDDLGNRTEKTLPGSGAKTTYVYDTAATNHLVSSKGPSVPPAGVLDWTASGKLKTAFDGTEHRHDGLGRRVWRADANGSNTVFHYDAAGRLIAETLPNGNKLREYFYVADQLVAVDGCLAAATPPCNGREWYHTDLLGNTVARTDRQGVVTVRLAYHPWGELDTPATPISETRRFNGRAFDAGTGWYDYGARTYSPELGRFVSSDPKWSFPSSPQHSNTYAYTLDNPYKYTDPNGEVPFLVVTGIIGGVAGGVMAAVQNQNLNGIEFAAAVAGGVGYGMLAGMTLGGGSAALLTGSWMASTTAVATGGYVAAGPLMVMAANAEGLGPLRSSAPAAPAAGLPAVSGGVDQFGMHRYHWAGGGTASFMQEGTEVIVDYVNRGGAPNGTAGAMLAESMRAAGITTPRTLMGPNVLQKTAESTRVVSRALMDAAEALGGAPRALASGEDPTGKTWVRVVIESR
jgi:RHS repeat-associated protein